MDIVDRNATDKWLRDQLKDKMPAGGTPKQMIADVSRRLARATGRDDWGPSTTARTEYRDGGTRILELNFWPIRAITSISDDTDHVWGSDTEIDATEFWVSLGRDGVNRNGLVYMENFNLVAGDENVRIIYTAGYTSPTDTTIPEDIKLAAYLQILHELTRQVPGAFTQTPGQFEGPAFDDFESTGLLGEVRDLLNPFTRRRHFA